MPIVSPPTMILSPSSTPLPTSCIY